MCGTRTRVLLAALGSGTDVKKEMGRGRPASQAPGCSLGGLSSPLPSCVTSGKCQNLSEPQFPLLQNGDKRPLLMGWSGGSAL